MSYLETPVTLVTKSKERFRRKHKVKKLSSGEGNRKLAQFHKLFQEEL